MSRSTTSLITIFIVFLQLQADSILYVNLRLLQKEVAQDETVLYQAVLSYNLLKDGEDGFDEVINVFDSRVGQAQAMSATSVSPIINESTLCSRMSDIPELEKVEMKNPLTSSSSTAVKEAFNSIKFSLVTAPSQTNSQTPNEEIFYELDTGYAEDISTEFIILRKTQLEESREGLVSIELPQNPGKYRIRFVEWFPDISRRILV